MKILVLIPCYNENRSITDVVGTARKYVEDVLVVDDGSSDETAQLAENAGAKVISHSENKGKGQALRTGFDYFLKGNWDAVVTVDGDGQHSLDEIPSFIKEAEKDELDIIIGCRMKDLKDMPLIRILVNKFTSLVVSMLSRQKIVDSQSGFRLIKRSVLENVQLSTSNFDTESEILVGAARKGYRVGEIVVKTIYKGEEISKIKPMRDTIRFFRLVFRMLKWRR